MFYDNNVLQTKYLSLHGSSLAHGLYQSPSRALYRISDPFLRFYFRYVVPNRSQLSLDQSEEINRHVKLGFSHFVASQWEEICRESLHRIYPDIPCQPAQSWWGNDRNGNPLELDLVSESTDRKVVFVGECKWINEINPEAILKELKEKTGRLNWLYNRYIRYLLFTKLPHPAPPDLKIITAEDVTLPATM